MSTLYQHPLAYLLGLEGIALLHAFAGDYDREFTLARLDEIERCWTRRGAGRRRDGGPIPTTEGYGRWAEFYDEPGNQLIDIEQPIVREILDGLPPASRSTPPAEPAATAPIWPPSGTR